MTTTYIDSECRGAGLCGQDAVHEYRAMRPGQPLFLMREPHNPVDPNAVLVMTVMLRPCGYLAREHAAVVAPDLDRGVPWFATCTHEKNAFRYPQVTLWNRGARLTKKFKELALACGASAEVVDRILAGDYAWP